MVRRHRVALIAGIAAAAGSLGLITPLALSASCVGPSLSVEPPIEPPRMTPAAAIVVRGESSTVYGEWFRDGCNDTGVSGCGVRVQDPESPLTDLELRLRQGDQSWPLGTADAGDRAVHYAVTWVFTVPDQARPGAATLETDAAELYVQVR